MTLSSEIVVMIEAGPRLKASYHGRTETAREFATRIAIATAERQAREVDDILREVSKTLDSSKVWGGMSWSFSPIHPHHYLKARELVSAYWDRREREANAAAGLKP